MQIGKKVADWYRREGRNMPWRDTKDPYAIWIAEVVFQQTRIAQGQDYYYRFMERFPDVYSLAAAEQDEVLKYWEGLGYYSRARNLHAAARQVVEDWKGIFPESHRELIRLKGVGDYTSRAISSFAFGEKVGVLDGNVLRVMSRVLADSSPINEPPTRKKFQTIVDDWVAEVDSREFNHGIMDIGATICTPLRPACLFCPLESACMAKAVSRVHSFPVKTKKLKRKKRYFYFFIHRNQDGEIAIRQRSQKGYWGGLWEIPNIEVEEKEWTKQVLALPASFHHSFKHVFTHFDMMIHVFETESLPEGQEEEIQFIAIDKIPIFAFAKAVLKIFEHCEI